MDGNNRCIFFHCETCEALSVDVLHNLSHLNKLMISKYIYAKREEHKSFTCTNPHDGNSQTLHSSISKFRLAIEKITF